MFLPLCDRVYMTRIAADGSADAFFPDLEHDPGWRLDKRSADMEKTACGFVMRYVPVKLNKMTPDPSGAIILP